jgi:hypothetical protein
MAQAALKQINNKKYSESYSDKNILPSIAFNGKENAK